MQEVRFNIGSAKKLLRGNREEVAGRLGMHPESFSRKINQTDKLNLEFINRLAEILNINPGKLLRIEETKGVDFE